MTLTLLAQVSSGEYWIGLGALVTVVGTSVAAIVNALHKARKERKADEFAQLQAARADAFAQLQVVADRLEKEIVTWREENKGLRKQVHDLRNEYHQEVMMLTVRISDCERDRVELRGEVKLLQAEVHRIDAVTSAVVGVGDVLTENVVEVKEDVKVVRADVEKVKNKLIDDEKVN